MRVTLKLYASLAVHLPAGADRNAAQIEVSGDATVRGVLDAWNVPPEQCHLVLVNGVFLPPAARSGRRLSEGDVLAVWPPVAGG